MSVSVSERGAPVAGAPFLGETFNRFALTERVLPRVLQTYAELYGTREFATLPGGSLTFTEAPQLAARAAAVFGSLTSRSGERVAVLVGNRLEFIASVWGQAWRGEMSAPLNPALKGSQLAYQLRRTRATVLVVEAGKLPDVPAIVAELPDLRHLVVVGDDDVALFKVNGISVHRWDELFAAADPVPPANVSFSAPLAVLFTSGTTGQAKGVVVTHHHYYCYAAPNVDNHRWGPSDHLFTPLPLCHTSAHLNVLMAGFMAGARVTIAERFSASRFWKEVVACGATHAALMGAMAPILMRQPYDPMERQHRLRTLAVAPPPIDLAAFEQRFGVRVLWQAYGQTEGYYNQRVLEQANKPRTCVGRPLPLFELEILDENDSVLEHDGATIGEIAVRPRQPYCMMTEYLDDPAATVAAFRNQWFHTGDLGSIDADGFVYLRGRKKDFIRRRGENVSALDVEREALQHPAIAEAAAFAVPSELGEDDIKLDVVLGDGAAKQDPAEVAADIARFLAGRLPKFMQPRYVQIRESLPMTPSQRVEKYRLQQDGVSGAHYDAGDGSRQAN